MNERIEELAEQAGYTKDMFGVGHWDMPECKKFAQLIVEDCIRTIQEKIPRSGPTPENTRSYDHLDDIALKYGIEFPIPYK